MDSKPSSVRQRAIDIELYEQRMNTMGDNARLRCEITRLKGQLNLALVWKKEFKDSLIFIIEKLKHDISLLED